MKLVSIAELLGAEVIRPIDVINTLDDYVASRSSIGKEFGKLFQRDLKFTERQKVRLRNALAKGIYQAAEYSKSDHVEEFAKAICVLKSLYP